MLHNWPDEIIKGVEKGDISVVEAFKQLEDADLYRPKSQLTPTNKIDGALRDLDGLIGLKEVKHLIHEISAYITIQTKRRQENLNTDPMVLHMIFKGNPGTGKTTVARIIGNIFSEMGVLTRGHLIEAERADLVGEYIGNTAQKTRDQLKKAYGGILFIDEAYSLARGGEKDFGKEAIDVLVKFMEDNRDNIIIILAGYLAEMEHFLQSNPGLRSRFPIHIEFPDYNKQELLQIADQMCAKRQYQLTIDAKTTLANILLPPEKAKDENFGNARTVRNIIEKAMRRQAVRLVPKQTISREDLMRIEATDLVEGNE